MKHYWPTARARTRTGKRERLSTYESCLSLDKALDQFSTWEDGYGCTISEAWIDVFEDGKQTRRLKVEKTWKVKEE